MISKMITKVYQADLGELLGKWLHSLKELLNGLTRPCKLDWKSAYFNPIGCLIGPN